MDKESDNHMDTLVCKTISHIIIKYSTSKNTVRNNSNTDTFLILILVLFFDLQKQETNVGGLVPLTAQNSSMQNVNKSIHHSAKPNSHRVTVKYIGLFVGLR